MELSYWGISPNIPAWPTDENGEREQAVLLPATNPPRNSLSTS